MKGLIVEVLKLKFQIVTQVLKQIIFVLTLKQGFSIRKSNKTKSFKLKNIFSNQLNRTDEYSACDFDIYFDAFNDYFILVEAFGKVKMEYHINSKKI